MTKRLALLAALAASIPTGAACAQEAFAGLYVHEVDTPLSLHVGETGADLALGYRFAPIAALAVIGKPAPYVIASLNSSGDTSFAGAGLGWTIGKGPAYVRPAIGVVVHDGPGRRVDPVTLRRTGPSRRTCLPKNFAPPSAWRATRSGSSNTSGSPPLDFFASSGASSSCRLCSTPGTGRSMTILARISVCSARTIAAC